MMSLSHDDTFDVDTFHIRENAPMNIQQCPFYKVWLAEFRLHELHKAVQVRGAFFNAVGLVWYQNLEFDMVPGMVEQ